MVSGGDNQMPEWTEWSYYSLDPQRPIELFELDGEVGPAPEPPRVEPVEPSPMRRCSSCSRLRELSAMTEATRAQWVCAACLSGYTRCPACEGLNRLGWQCGSVGCEARLWQVCGGCYRPAREATTVYGDGVVCGQCRDAAYGQCPRCGGWDTRNYHRRTCRFGCEPCPCGCGVTIREVRQRRPVERVVHDYSYRPDPVFFGRGPVFLGAEIEVATPAEHRLELAAQAAEQLGRVAYLKNDSSIGDGFEIVTHPMSYQYAMQDFPWDVLPMLEEAGAEATDTTGLHVHVSRDGFSDRLHTYRWMKFFYRNQTAVLQVARRHSDRWAAFTPVARQYAKEYAKGTPSEWSLDTPDIDRYHAINVLNPYTLEVRVFASSLQPDDVKAALGLVAASVEYTRHLTARDILHRNGWEFTRFTEWVAEREEYAPLYRHITNGGQLCAF